MILLLAREIGFIQESENGNRGFAVDDPMVHCFYPLQNYLAMSTNQLFRSVCGSRPMQLEEISED
jgi:hypothetical protein